MEETLEVDGKAEDMHTADRLVIVVSSACSCSHPPAVPSGYRLLFAPVVVAPSHLLLGAFPDALQTSGCPHSTRSCPLYSSLVILDTPRVLPLLHTGLQHQHGQCHEGRDRFSQGPRKCVVCIHRPVLTTCCHSGCITQYVCLRRGLCSLKSLSALGAP